jgi:hypothetical protein
LKAVTNISEKPDASNYMVQVIKGGMWLGWMWIIREMTGELYPNNMNREDGMIASHPHSEDEKNLSSKG